MASKTWKRQSKSTLAYLYLIEHVDGSFGRKKNKNYQSYGSGLIAKIRNPAFDSPTRSSLSQMDSLGILIHYFLNQRSSSLLVTPCLRYRDIQMC